MVALPSDILETVLVNLLDNSRQNGASGVAGKGDGKLENDPALKPNSGQWGHLPENRRKEMDAFSKERFMPRYEELLRAYYRNIAEGARRKDD